MPVVGSPGSRFAALVAAECVAFERHLRRMIERTGAKRDRAVHEGRKALQRLRALLRLAAPDDDGGPLGASERRVRALRRRLGRLRDAAVRVELVQKLVEHEPAAAANEHVRAALTRLEEARTRTWAEHGGDFLPRLGRDWKRARARLQRHPTTGLSEARVHESLERVRRGVRRKLRDALGVTRRATRHELRRVLRRYGAMRTAAAHVLKRRDRWATRLSDVGREVGVEGDLWLTRTALLFGDRHAEVRALARALESQRRALCKLHDGELVALRRQALAKPPRPATRRVPRPARAARTAASASA